MKKKGNKYVEAATDDPARIILPDIFPVQYSAIIDYSILQPDPSKWKGSH